MPKKTSVIGLGYLGVTQAAVLASLGHEVTGVDTDKTKIDLLRQGKVPFYEPGLEDLLNNAIGSGRLRFCDTISELPKEIDLHFLCVGTPAKDSGAEVDTSYLREAMNSLATVIAENATIVGRSTVPVGTADELEAQLSALTSKKFDLIWNPEFLSEGTAIRNSLDPERIVIGSNSARAEAILRDTYREIIARDVPVISLDRRTSELVKIASNAFLALKISYINGVAEIAEKTGASTAQLADAMGLDSRIGRKFLNNGLGFGGGCLPKDLAGFAKFAEEKGSSAFYQMLQSASIINEDRQNKVIEFAKELLGDLAGRKITVLGASFKKNTDDVRNSPGLSLAKTLVGHGAAVVVHNPIPISVKMPTEMAFNFSLDLDEAVLGSSLVIFASDWDSYKKISPEDFTQRVQEKNIIDARSIIQAKEWKSFGWKIRILGESQEAQANG